MEDYEMKYLQMKEAFWKECIQYLRYYQIFILPNIITKIKEVSIEKAQKTKTTEKA